MEVSTLCVKLIHLSDKCLLNVAETLPKTKDTLMITMKSLSLYMFCLN